MASTLTKVSLVLTPADVALFHESRPLGQGTPGARSDMPYPQTAAGAVRTWLFGGCGVSLGPLPGYLRQGADIITALEACCTAGGVPQAAWITRARFSGPVLCRRSDAAPLITVPRTLVRRDDTRALEVLAPLLKGVPGARRRGDSPSAAILHPLWLTSGASWSQPTGFLAADDWEGACLHGSALSQKSLRSEAEFLLHESRLGIGMDSDRRTSADGLLYSVQFLRLKPEYGFRVDLEADEDVLQQVKIVHRSQPWVRFGGEGKVARIGLFETAPPWPRPPAWSPQPGARFFTYMATPAFFESGGWFPRHLTENCILAAAAVGDPLLFSGWGIHQGRPSPTRCATRAGTVHFWEVKRDADLGALIDPDGTHLSDAQADRQAGWGLCFRGGWDYV